MSTEEFKLNGEELIAKVRALIHEGNIRRITIKNPLLTKCSIVVEKK